MLTATLGVVSLCGLLFWFYILFSADRYSPEEVLLGLMGGGGCFVFGAMAAMMRGI